MDAPRLVPRSAVIAGTRRGRASPAFTATADRGRSGRQETSSLPVRYWCMGLDDVPAHLQARVERLVQKARAELEARGVDTTGKLPRQILRLAQIERHKPGLERGRRKRLDKRA